VRILCYGCNLRTFQFFTPHRHLLEWLQVAHVSLRDASPSLSVVCGFCLAPTRIFYNSCNPRTINCPTLPPCCFLYNAHAHLLQNPRTLIARLGFVLFLLLRSTHILCNGFNPRTFRCATRTLCRSCLRVFFLAPHGHRLQWAVTRARLVA